MATIASPSLALPRRSLTMKVKLKPGWAGTYPEFTLGNVYRVLGIEADDLRIINDAGDPVLYHPRAFTYVDPTYPADWIEKRGDEGEVYAYPAQFREPRYFFEELHDGNANVRSKLTWYVYEQCRAEHDAGPPPPNSYLQLNPKPEGVNDPVTYVELDEDRLEVRKVHVFSDGRVTSADGKGSTGTTTLRDAPLPALGELGANAKAITRDEFEDIWNKALDSDVP